MPQNTNIAVPAKTWTLLTDADVTNLTFQNAGRGSVAIKATVGAVAPTNTNGAFVYASGQGELNGALSEMFPGLSGANRVYAYSHQGTTLVVSHA